MRTILLFKILYYIQILHTGLEPMEIFFQHEKK